MSLIGTSAISRGDHVMSASGGGRVANIGSGPGVWAVRPSERSPLTHVSLRRLSALHGPIEPVGDDLRNLVAVLFQHHHVTVTADAKVGELDEGHIDACLLKILDIAMIVA